MRSFETRNRNKTFGKVTILVLLVPAALIYGVIVHPILFNHQALILDTSLVDFGDVAPNSVVEHDFGLTNQSRRPITILQIKKSCGCVEAWASSDVILPAGKVIISASAVMSKFAGPFKEGFIIETDDPQNEKIGLTIKGVVKKYFELGPFDYISFKNVPVNETVSQTIHIQSLENESFQVTGFELTRTDLFKIEIGRVRDFGFDLTVSTRGIVMKDAITDELRLKTDSQHQKEIPINLYAVYLGTIEVVPDKLFLGHFQNGDTIEKDVELVYLDRPETSPAMSVAGLTKEDSGLELKHSIQEIPNGYRLSFTFTPVEVKGFVTNSILIQTGLIHQPTVTIPISGLTIH